MAKKKQNLTGQTQATVTVDELASKLEATTELLQDKEEALNSAATENNELIDELAKSEESCADLTKEVSELKLQIESDQGITQPESVQLAKLQAALDQAELANVTIGKSRDKLVEELEQLRSNSTRVPEGYVETTQAPAMLVAACVPKDLFMSNNIRFLKNMPDVITKAVTLADAIFERCKQ